MKEGVKEKFTVEDSGSKPEGTYVEFVPSQEVYRLEPIKIEFSEIKKMCQDWSYLCKGLKFVLKDEMTSEEVTYLSKNGLVDLMLEKGGRALNKTPLSATLKEDGVEAEICLEWTDRRNEEWHVFTNGLENSEGGTSLTGVKTALTNFFKKKVKGDVSPETLRKGLFYAVSCKIPNPSFSDQTKTKINSPILRGLCQRATTQMLNEFELKHRDEFEKVIELLTREAKADIAAEKARKQVLDAAKDVEKNQKRKVFASDKLKDAEFIGQGATLCLVEGLSAGSSIAMSRDEKHYGILSLRGKPVNAFGNSEEKFFQNEEIKLLLSAMNIVPGKYDSKKLRYGRLAICSDAD